VDFVERVSIADVAKVAGVSEMTVSRVMNGKQYVAEATRHKVMAAVESLGYHPNRAAQSLSSQRTYIVGVVVDTGSVGDASFREMVTGLEEGLGNEGYSLLLHSLRREPHYATYLYQSRQVDGVVVLSGPHANREEIATLHQSGLPYVVVGRRQVPSIEPIYVSPDYAGAYAEAAQYLLDLGHRRIGYYSEGVSFEPHSDRLAGIHRTLEAAGQRVAVLNGEGMNEEQRDLLLQSFIQNQGITALMVSSTYDTLSAIRVARQAGLSIPDDLSLVGFDFGTQYYNWIALTDQSISAVIMPARDLGRLAAQTLLDQFQGAVISQPRLLPIPFVKGRSCAPPRA